ncbi:MAG: hypothetical protein CM1200mP10_32870 [Candidatus Neomarinimicrobiota bacterium]|nr:MAG: hypothetical protein CM1200mP10_32870 [Candidatus Neomarinimicrobiota bacterium]
MHAIINLRHDGKWHKETTVGRAIFNSIIPKELEYADLTISKNDLVKIINQTYLVLGIIKPLIF